MKADPPARPTISVVTPTLNAAAFITGALESVRSQQPKALEHIVVDGGSSDGTRERVQSYGEDVTLVDAPGGHSSAINRGVALAGGDIIGILNADDWYCEGAFEHVLHAFAARPEADVVYGNARLADASGHIVGTFPVEAFSRDSLLQRCIICQPASFIRRDAFERAGGMDESNRLTLDYDFWLRLSKMSEFVMIEASLAVSRDHGANKSAVHRTQAIHEALEAARRSCGYVPYSWAYAYVYRLMGEPDNAQARSAAVALGLAYGVMRSGVYAPDAARDWLRHRSLGRRLG